MMPDKWYNRLWRPSMAWSILLIIVINLALLPILGKKSADLTDAFYVYATSVATVYISARTIEKIKDKSDFIAEIKALWPKIKGFIIHHDTDTKDTG